MPLFLVSYKKKSISFLNDILLLLYTLLNSLFHVFYPFLSALFNQLLKLLSRIVHRGYNASLHWHEIYGRQELKRPVILCSP